MTVYFDNCLGACKNATFDVPDGTRIDDIVARCRETWGDGRLLRTGRDKSLTWVKDSDGGDWRGCCAEKIAGRTP